MVLLSSSSELTSGPHLVRVRVEACRVAYTRRLSSFDNSNKNMMFACVF